MTQGEKAEVGAVIIYRMEFYRGVHDIAKFLGITERQARRMLNSGQIPAKKDMAGRWVLTSRDYFESLQG
jgi:hypothetical protein